jgi:serine phosphatase RsbU (regulator of sigma subunit)
VTDVKSFTGKAIQHDDMTMVVVKYLQDEKNSS